MTTLTRATLGQQVKRQTKTIAIDGVEVTIQRPSPLQYTDYVSQSSAARVGDGFEMEKFASAIMLLVARMWIDANGNRLFSDEESSQIDSMVDNGFYSKLSEECQGFVGGGDAKKTLGESDKTTDSDLPAESA